MKLLLTLLFFAHSSYSAEVHTIKNVDIEKYLGSWYEISSIPQKFQRKCEKNSRAQYSKGEDGELNVVNSCTIKDGSVESDDARARVVDDGDNAKLKVTFVKLIKWIYMFGGDYWILDVDQDYNYALIGHPTREYGWILSRTPSLSDELITRAKEVLEENGYDSCKFLMTIQDGGNQLKEKLCKI